MNIVCSGYIVRYPLSGQSWHHVQYLIGFQRLGHTVTFVEHWGWPGSCYDPSRNLMTGSPEYGLRYLVGLLRLYGLDSDWCYLAEDGTTHGLSRPELARRCRDADLWVNLSGVTWIPELETCRRKLLVDTDPTFTQLGGHGLGPRFDWYDTRFTFGENVHRPGCSMPTAGVSWRTTRQPVVLDLWPRAPGDPTAPFTTVMNWSSYGERVHGGRVYGQKDTQFAPFFTLPRDVGEPMEIALSAPPEVCGSLRAGGWRLTDPRQATRTPAAYQRYVLASRAEFSVAKGGYVTTRSGWFSERSAGYLASGRPVILEDTGFSDYLPCGRGLLAFADRGEAVAAIRHVTEDYVGHCGAAREIAEEFFDARVVLRALLEAGLGAREPETPISR